VRKILTRLALVALIGASEFIFMQGIAQAEPPTCPAGSKLNGLGCAEDVVCPAGYFMGAVFTTSACCPNGTTAEGGDLCVKGTTKTTAVSAKCPPGFKFTQGECLAPPHCPGDTHLINGNCVLTTIDSPKIQPNGK
jgi:hypothetical protein